MLPYEIILPLAAICLSAYFVVAAPALARAKAVVLAILLFAMALPRVAPRRPLVGMGVQLALSIGLILYFKEHSKRA